MIAGNDMMMLRADRKQDEVYTPYCAVELLLEFLPKDKIIWCPFDEEWSAFYKLLSERGYKVLRSSLKEGQDFFEYEPQHWDILVSNPPYSRKDDVLERAFKFNKPFALLLPTATIQGQKRHKIFMNEIQMLVPDSRINYHTGLKPGEIQKNCYFSTAYFCRDLLPSKLELRPLKKYERWLLYIFYDSVKDVYDKLKDFDVDVYNPDWKYSCRSCGAVLRYMYCEARIYAIVCPKCRTVTLTAGRNPKEAFELVGVKHDK